MITCYSCSNWNSQCSQPSVPVPSCCRLSHWVMASFHCWSIREADCVSLSLSMSVSQQTELMSWGKPIAELRGLPTLCPHWRWSTTCNTIPRVSTKKAKPSIHGHSTSQQSSEFSWKQNQALPSLLIPKRVPGSASLCWEGGMPAMPSWKCEASYGARLVDMWF